MESLPNRNSIDDSYDYLIAFLVILGALAFIVSQSFSTPTTPQSKVATTTTASNSQKKPKYTRKKEEETSYYETMQAKRKFEEKALRKWTDDLEEKQIHNTAYHLPKETVPAVASAVPATIVETTTAEPKSSPQKVLEEAPPTGATIVKEKSVFIDTDNNKKAKQTNKVSPATSSSNNQETKNNTTTIATKPIEEKVKTYENTTPRINLDQKKTPETNTLVPKSPIQKKAISTPSCVIMIAALKDKKNIDNLLQSLKKEKYEIYNKISGKHRTIGIRTSCDPSIHRSTLRKIKKKYSETAFLLKR